MHLHEIWKAVLLQLLMLSGIGGGAICVVVVVVLLPSSQRASSTLGLVHPSPSVDHNRCSVELAAVAAS